MRMCGNATASANNNVRKPNNQWGRTKQVVKHIESRNGEATKKCTKCPVMGTRIKTVKGTRT